MRLQMSTLDLLTEMPIVTGERTALRRTEFGAAARVPLNSSTSTTLENNEKFRPRGRAENGFCQEFG